jgi:hypothetical protein
MRVEKEKRKVNIICKDQSVITGFIHINPGERVMDFLNRDSEAFIIVTNAEFHNVGRISAFRLYNELMKKRNTVCLNKNAIKLLEEI